MSVQLRKYSIYILVLFLPCLNLFGQFGKNKVQYQDFDWKYIQSKHFDIYYYDSTYNLAVFTALKAEDALKKIENTLNYVMNSRVSIIVYNTHNEFQQTNVIGSYLPEGVGGVTELYKNRVVLPYMGNISQFRHVIHHELIHAVMNDMFYGGTFQTAVSTGNTMDIPMWMSEGLAEYSSLGGLNTQTDMFMRDVSLSESLTDLKSLDNYYAYRGGQAFYWYVADKYGEQKVGDLLNRLRVTGTAEKAFKSSFNLSMDDFSEQWKKDMKKYYWPDIEKYKDPEDYATRITNHKKDNGFYNSSPSISPNGDKMAFISDRDGTFGIYTMDLNKKDDPERLVNSFRKRDFEQLNILTPGISWDPTGKKLVVSAKSGGEDAIFIVDVKDGDYDKLFFGLRSITSVTWSPDGEKLAFIGSSIGQSDIFMYNMKSKKLTNLTSDAFSDFFPVWSKDSKKLYFISDRGENIDDSKLSSDFRIWNYNYESTDIYSMNIDSKKITRITFDSEYEKTSLAISPDENKLLFVSDKNGIGNIYETNLKDGSTKPKTNSLTGITQLSLSPSGNELLFCTQSNGKYDIFLIRNPLTQNLGIDTLPNSKFRNSLLEKKKIAQNIEKMKDLPDTSKPAVLKGYGNYDLEFSRSEVVKPNIEALEKQKNEDSGLSSGQVNDTTFVEKEYKIRFSPDVVMGNPTFSTLYGYQNMAQVLFSDVLGNHQIYLQLSLLSDLRNSSIMVTYNYLPKIIDYSFSIFHNSLMYQNRAGDILRVRNYGASVAAFYPFDLFNRLEFNLNWWNLSRDNLTNAEDPSVTRMLFIPSARYVHDDVLYGFMAPIKGIRYFIGFTGTPKITASNIGFITLNGDFRYYLPISEYINFATRVSGGGSFGPDPRGFFLGGTENWINRQFKYDNLPFDKPEDFAFMNFEMPLRGWRVNEIQGTRFFVTNLELRFPILIGLLAGRSSGFIQGLMGSLFMDVGGAWDGAFKNFQSGAVSAEKNDYSSYIKYLYNSNQQGISEEEYNTKVKPFLKTEPKNLLMSTGIGLRGYLLGLPLKLDVSWSNMYYGWTPPWYLVSLGFDF